MKFSPIKITLRFLCFIFCVITLVLACNKDENEPYSAVEEVTISDITKDKNITKLTAKSTEMLTKSFFPTNDAYVQSGVGYDQKIVRLEDGRRKSYLMFDLRGIESTGGTLVSAELEFTVSSDGGDGTISIFQGEASSWTEERLSASSAPVPNALLAEVTDEYEIGQTKKIGLENEKLSTGIITLVLTHKNGNDLAFASKEHPDDKKPRLIVSYQAPIDTDSTSNNETEEEENSNDENKPIAAVISGSIPPSSQVPSTINFKAWNSKNQNAITGYFWDFGDGSTTTKKNPSHTFTEPGEYTVKLTVKNAEGFRDTTTFDITVTGSSTDNGESGNGESDSDDESLNFAAVISGSIPTSAEVPATIDFKAWNSKNQNEINGYFWDFGDGSTTTRKNPSHTFTEAGNYTVKLSVKNAKGQTHTTTRNISITGASTNNDDSESGSGSGSGGSESGSDSGGSSGGTGGSESGGGSSSSGDYPSNAVFASDFGFRTGDATDAFKAALKSGSSYVVIDKQSSDWVIRPTRFYDLRDMTIVFEPGVVLRAKSGAFRNGARMFKLTRARNVTIEGSGATFRMNKSEYTSGEQRHAFEMDMCNGVTVRGLTIRDSGGAGVMIFGDGNGGYSQNITLENVKSLNNRRDGITITSAQNVWVRNSEFSKSSGTRPEAGVVLETDHTTDRLVNINFVNCKFSDNKSAGIHFTASQMDGSSKPISIKVVDSEFSNNAISPPDGFKATEVEIGGGEGTNVVGGEIRFERVKFNGSRGRIVFTRKSANGFQAVFKDCEARNVVSSTDASPIGIAANHSRSTLGGIRFDNFYLQYNRNIPFMKIAAPSQKGNFRVKDIRGTFTLREPGDNPIEYFGSYREENNINVSIDYNHN